MENKLIRFIFGSVILLLSFVIMPNVSAQALDSIEDGNNFVNANVTVGKVDAPVYVVDINWDDLSFDWVYDNSTKSFGWQPSPICHQFYDPNITIEEALMNGTKLYADRTCSTAVDSYDDTIPYYYFTIERDSVGVYIFDYSQYTEIVPSITWTSSDKYDYVIGNFEYEYLDDFCRTITDEELFEVAIDNNVTIYSDSSCTTNILDENLTYSDNTYYAWMKGLAYKQLNSDEIPNDGRVSTKGWLLFSEMNDALVDDGGHAYLLKFELENDLEKEINTPSNGETIGTITISIRGK